MDYKDINDYELLYLIEDQDENYKAILFYKYDPVIKKIAKQYFDQYKKYLDDYDDVYQEGAIGLNYAIDHFDSRKNVTFYTYVLLCVESKIKDYVRTLCRNKHLILKNAASFSEYIGEDIFLEDVIATDDLAYQTILLRDLERSFIVFKNDLSIRESQIFELRFNGFSYQEISNLLEIKKENIYSYIRQIRQKFRNLKQEDCFF